MTSKLGEMLRETVAWVALLVETGSAARSSQLLSCAPHDLSPDVGAGQKPLQISAWIVCCSPRIAEQQNGNEDAIRCVQSQSLELGWIC